MSKLVLEAVRLLVGWRRRRFAAGLCVVCVLFAPGGGRLAAGAAGKSGDPIEPVIRHLREEITAWSKDRSKPPPRSDWGHPKVQALDKALAGKVLERIRRPIPGCKDIELTYVRWQMLWLAAQMPPEDLNKSAGALLALLRMAPQPVELMHYTNEEVRAIRNIWDRLPHEHIGYYPFHQHRINFEKLKDPRERKKLQDEYEVMKAMVAKIEKRIAQPNKEAGNANVIVLGYQDRLAELLVRTGDPKAFTAVLAAINKYLSLKSHRAFTLLARVYAEVSDGALKRYAPDDLRKLGRQLEAQRTKYEGMQSYAAVGRYRHWDRTNMVSRDLADAMFHLMQQISRQAESEKEAGSE